jgi:hypothetical protein
MIYPDYRDTFWILAGIPPLSFGVWLLWLTRKGRFIPSLFIRLIAVSVVGVGGFWVTAAVFWYLKADRSAPVFSPDHTRALRVTAAADLSPRSTVVVDLYSFHGLVSERIYDSGVNLAVIGDVRWLSDSEVEIGIVDGEGGDICKDARRVKVRCVVAPDPHGTPTGK